MLASKDKPVRKLGLFGRGEGEIPADIGLKKAG